MNFLNEIQGLKEENLSSAVIRMLLLQSHQLRDAFIDLLSSKSKQGPIFVTSRFSCVTELPTHDDSHGRGRIDFVLETDEFLIGVENKINAGFQEGQPVKYINTLKNKSTKQYKDGSVDLLKTMMAILAPESRIKQISEEVAKLSQEDRDIIGIVSWQEVIKAFGDAINSCDNISQVFFNELKEFMIGRISFMPSFKAYYHHFRNNFIPMGSQFQSILAGRLWKYFPDPGPRLSASGSWCGYYFNYGKKHKQCWYGFVDTKTQLKDYSGKNPAEFIIAVPFDISDIKHDKLIPVELTGRNFTDAGVCNDSAIIVDFDINWDDPEKWEEIISCFSNR